MKGNARLNVLLTVFVIVTLLTVGIFGFRAYNASKYMPDFSRMAIIGGDIYGVCSGDTVAYGVFYDADGDKQYDYVAYYLVPAALLQSVDPKWFRAQRPFIVQKDGGRRDSIDGDVFYLDANLDGVIDAKMVWPDKRLGSGPCDTARANSLVKIIF